MTTTPPEQGAQAVRLGFTLTELLVVIVIIGIIFILSGILAFSIARSLSDPIARLSEGAAIVGSGHLDYQVGTDHKDEIGQLSGKVEQRFQFWHATARDVQHHAPARKIRPVADAEAGQVAAVLPQ